MTAEIVVFGRWPEPGRVKTRLAHAIGPTAATGVYRALLDHTLVEAAATKLPVTLALVGTPKNGGWRVPTDVRIESQAEGDLGKRMRSAFENRFVAGARAAVLIGSDLPYLTAGLIMKAVAALERVPAVLGPATDGGYWLLGQTAPGYDLFSGVPWSSRRTADATRRRIAEIPAPHDELSVLRDLDTVQDLEAALDDDALDHRLRTGFLEALPQRWNRCFGAVPRDMRAMPVELCHDRDG